jgi:putative transposase
MRNCLNSVVIVRRCLRKTLSYQSNEKWVSDITAIWTQEGWLYLAVIMDLYSRKIIGWAMSERMKQDLMCEVQSSAREW